MTQRHLVDTVRILQLYPEFCKFFYIIFFALSIIFDKWGVCYVGTLKNTVVIRVKLRVERKITILFIIWAGGGAVGFGFSGLYRAGFI